MSVPRYCSISHRNNETGYQNVAIAQDFAKWVVDRVIKRHPEAKDGIVNIITVDTSTTFLAAAVKFLMPNWFIVAGVKAEPEIDSRLKEYPAANNVVTIFVDDYISGGGAARSALYALFRRVAIPDIGKEFMFFSIDKCSGFTSEDMKDGIFSKLEDYSFWAMYRNISSPVFQSRRKQ